jgi:hypothetical protein
VIPNPNPNPNTVSPFSKSEIALGLLLMYPQHRVLIADLIPPDEEFASTVYRAMKEAQDEEEVVLSPEISERANILQLFCEKHGFGDWSQSLALREIKNNILHANRELLHIKQRQIADKLLEAQKSGKTADQQKLQTQYLEVLKLSKLAG